MMLWILGGIALLAVAMFAVAWVTAYQAQSPDVLAWAALPFVVGCGLIVLDVSLAAGWGLVRML